MNKRLLHRAVAQATCQQSFHWKLAATSSRTIPFSSRKALAFLQRLILADRRASLVSTTLAAARFAEGAGSLATLRSFALHLRS